MTWNNRTHTFCGYCQEIRPLEAIFCPTCHRRVRHRPRSPERHEKWKAPLWLGVKILMRGSRNSEPKGSQRQLDKPPLGFNLTEPPLGFCQVLVGFRRFLACQKSSGTDFPEIRNMLFSLDLRFWPSWHNIYPAKKNADSYFLPVSHD